MGQRFSGTCWYSCVACGLQCAETDTDMEGTSLWKAVFPSPFTPGGHNTNKNENSSSLSPDWLCLNPPPTQSSQQLWGPGVPKVTCQCQVYSAVLAPRPKACTGEGGMRVVECGCLTSQLTHLRSWEQNVLRGRGA